LEPERDNFDTVPRVLGGASGNKQPFAINKKAARCRVASLIKIPVNPSVAPEFFQCYNQFWQQNAF